MRILQRRPWLWNRRSVRDRARWHLPLLLPTRKEWKRTRTRHHSSPMNNMSRHLALRKESQLVLPTLIPINYCETFVLNTDFMSCCLLRMIYTSLHFLFLMDLSSSWGNLKLQKYQNTTKRIIMVQKPSAASSNVTFFNANLVLCEVLVELLMTSRDV